MSNKPAQYLLEYSGFGHYVRHNRHTRQSEKLLHLLNAESEPFHWKKVAAGDVLWSEIIFGLYFFENESERTVMSIQGIYYIIHHFFCMQFKIIY